MVLSVNIPEELIHMELGNAGIVALLGYAVVFLGLILLMVVTIIIGRIFIAQSNRASAKAKSVIQAPQEPVPVQQPSAPGTAGQLKLHDVKPATAAMIMAIVAHKLDKPLNELRFISIKEVK